MVLAYLLSRLRQGERAGEPVEQHDAEAVFESAHVLRDGTLAHAQLFGGERKFECRDAASKARIALRDGSSLVFIQEFSYRQLAQRLIGVPRRKPLT